MLFNSIAYLIFLPLIFLIWKCLPHKNRWLVLLLGSCLFYCFYIPAYLIVLFLLITADYFLALKIQTEQKSKRKIYLVISICLNAGLLIFFKVVSLYLSGGLVHTYNDSETSYLLQNYLLPLGISFHTFQSMSYIIEVYRGNYPAEKKYSDVALYVMFFPQLVAGPIERPYKLLPQLQTIRFVSSDMYAAAIKLIIWGFFKKIVIADRFAPLPDAVFANPANYDGTAVALAAIFFSVQIYCDFSGYTDIARGSAKLFGIDLSRNFNKPYFSSSIIAFWRNWHISLSSWFRDYIYIPLGGKKSKYQLLLILLIFILSGLWHGLGLTFLIWATLHAVFVWANKLIGKNKKIQLPRPLSILLTFLIVTLLWICFRAESSSDIIILFKSLFTDINFNKDSLVNIILLLRGDRNSIDFLLINILVLIPLIVYDSGILSKNRIKKIYGSPATWVIIILLILLLGEFGFNNFIYFQF